MVSSKLWILFIYVMQDFDVALEHSNKQSYPRIEVLFKC